MKSLYEIVHKRRLLDAQIEVYLSWTRGEGRDSSMYCEPLEMFKRVYPKDDIMLITNDDIVAFFHHAQKAYVAQYQIIAAERALSGLVRFYSARGTGKGRTQRHRLINALMAVKRTIYHNA